VLVERAPEVVSKATLFAQVWPGTFIEESTLRYHMSTLRKALGDGEDGSRYIHIRSIEISVLAGRWGARSGAFVILDVNRAASVAAMGAALVSELSRDHPESS
jgi:hypothetical protein